MAIIAAVNTSCKLADAPAVCRWHNCHQGQSVKPSLARRLSTLGSYYWAARPGWRGAAGLTGWAGCRQSSPGASTRQGVSLQQEGVPAAADLPGAVQGPGWRAWPRRRPGCGEGCWAAYPGTKQAGRQGPSLPLCARCQTQSVRPVVTHRTGRPRAVSEGYSQETDTGTESDTLYR